jgi:hypothetical protein
MNMVQRAVEEGGKLHPLVIDTTGAMNPSIFIDDDGDILVILRNVNYTLYHSENEQRFPSRWGPLAYLHPEKDLRLVTTNYLCRLNSDLQITDFTKIDTSALDVPPLWEFVGEEDCRLVQWEGEYYAIGVRRDTTTNGQGRMELSKLAIDKVNWSAKEVSRVRMPTPGADDSYCEKNWMPILDKPFHFIKWSSPAEVVRVVDGKCEQVSVKQGVQPPRDQRGGSQLIRWGQYYISFAHEVSLFKNYLVQKDGVYYHRLQVWDNDLNLIGLSPKNFNFLGGRIEFCVGAAKYNDDLLVSFGFQDNAAFVLRVPGDTINEMVEEALTYAE